MSKKNITSKDINTEHQIVFPKCELLCKELARQIEFIIENEKIVLGFPLQFRAKTLNSIQSKIDDGRYNIKKTILELQDLAGIRIITLFKRDTNNIINILKDKFSIITVYNTQDKMDDSEFGYSSTHLVCMLKKEWLSIPSFAELKDIKFEIQVRTVSQHSWAEVSNKLQYKKDESVPKPLRRAISRISALLEIVDNEFETLLQDRENYVTNIGAELANNENLALNIDNLKEIVYNKLPERFRTDDDFYPPLLTELQYLNFDSKKLIKLIDDNLIKSTEEDKRIVDDLKESYELYGNFNQSEYHVGDDPEDIKRLFSGTFHNPIGLIRKMIKYEYGEDILKKII